jgi:hypothetical protein
MESGLHIIIFRTIKVAFVQNYRCWHIIHLACDQKPVKERQFHLWKVQGDHKECPVKICGDDVVAFEDMLKKLSDISEEKNIVMTASIAVEDCPDGIKAYA